MSSTLVIVPSRGRPHNIRRLIDGFARTKSSNNTKLLVAVDNDDPELPGYEAIAYSEDTPDWVQFITGPRLRLGGTLNARSAEVVGQYDILGFMGDDHLPQTWGWDGRIVQAMVPGGVVYGNDLFQRQNLPTAVFMDAALVKSLGYFVPRGLIHLYFDNIWKDWGEQTGRLRYLDDVVIEHIHPAAGKGELDAGYAEVNAAPIWTADEARYAEYKSNGEFAADIEKILAL